MRIDKGPHVETSYTTSYTTSYLSSSLAVTWLIFEVFGTRQMRSNRPSSPKPRGRINEAFEETSFSPTVPAVEAATPSRRDLSRRWSVVPGTEAAYATAAALGDEHGISMADMAVVCVENEELY